MKKLLIFTMLCLIFGGCGGDAATDSDTGDGGADGSVDGGNADGDVDSDGDADSDVTGDLLVRITEPDDGEAFLSTEVVEFECGASLSSTQAVAGAQYEWTVQPAGMILFGRNASSQVPAGEQTVTCYAEDPVSGKSGVDQVSISVGDATVRITDPDDGARFPESGDGVGSSDSITFTARGQSVESGNAGTYSWVAGPASGLMGQEIQTSLPVGLNVVTVTFTDTASNSAVDSIEVEVLTLEDWNICQSAPETCNGIDDNCDGDVDEGEISCGVGRCSREMDKCVNGEDNVCVPGEPRPELCNDEDDDCDGSTDEYDSDMSSLCEDPDRICAEGDCVDFGIADQCDSCPCDQCGGDGFDMELCCELPDVGVVCIDMDREDNCPTS